MLTPDQAAAIARKHGLSLMDAAGLLSLADDEDAAEAIAANFSTASNDDDGELRDFAAKIFGRDTNTQPEEPEAPTPGVTPREGNNPSTTNKADRELRKFTARLFDTPDQDHR